MGHLDFTDIPFVDPYIGRLADGHWNTDPTHIALLPADLFYLFTNNMDKANGEPEFVDPKSFLRWIDGWLLTGTLRPANMQAEITEAMTNKLEKNYDDVGCHCKNH